MAAQERPAAPTQPTPTEEADEGEEIVVQATRSGGRVQDEPIRVEVLDREEIEEKILMQPGNIAMLVNETPGLRVQVTSPALGAANVRVQGLKGRYTQTLANSLPLYGGQTPSIGHLQIPRPIWGRSRSSRARHRRSTGRPRWAASSTSCRGVRRRCSWTSCC